MSDFKWEMQQRIDAGMSPEAAYNETRDAYASAWDNRDKFKRQLDSLVIPERSAYSWDASWSCSKDDVDESGGVREQ